MFTDIVGFSRMMEENEAQTLELLEYHNSLIEDTVEKNNGNVIKTIGDAYLVDFPTALSAVESAIEIQKKLSEHPKLTLRIGIHLGDIYFYENDALGEGINIASRLESIAEPGRIVISKAVHELVSNKVEMRVTPLGSVDLKNISREIIAYEIIPGSPVTRETLEAEVDSIMEEEIPHTASPRMTRESQEEAARKVPETPAAQEVKDFVMSQIKKAGKQFHVDDIKRKIPNGMEEVGDILDKLTQRGYLAPGSGPHQKRALTPLQRLRRRRKGVPFDDPQGEDLYLEYREKTLGRFQQEQGGFLGHLIPYLAVNGGLLFLNLTSSPGHPWFLYPAGGWGIGLANHWAQWRLMKWEKNILLKHTSMENEEFFQFRELVKARQGFMGHTVSTFAISGFLIMINVITGGGFPWSLIPTAALVLPWMGHWSSYSSKIRKIRKTLRSMGKSTFPGKIQKTKKGMENASPKQIQAENLKEDILKQLKSFKKKNQYGDDMKPLLNNYVDQIGNLSQRGKEIDNIIESIPLGALKVDQDKLKKRAEREESKYLKEEFEKSISEIDRQLNSFNKLREQREIIDLRVNSALNNLSQMKLDLARMKSLSEPVGGMSIHKLRESSEEMAHYLEDFTSAMDELD